VVEPEYGGVSAEVLRVARKRLAFPRWPSGPVDEVRNRGSAKGGGRPLVHHRIIWQPAKCSLGDSPEAAQWVGLGQGSTIPYDDQIVGNGDFEGSRVIQGAVSTASQTAPSENVKIEDMMAGRAGRDVAAVLKTATPQGRDSRLVPSAECG